MVGTLSAIAYARSEYSIKTGSMQSSDAVLTLREKDQRCRSQ